MDSLMLGMGTNFMFGLIWEFKCWLWEIIGILVLGMGMKHSHPNHQQSHHISLAQSETIKTHKNPNKQNLQNQRNWSKNPKIKVEKTETKVFPIRNREEKQVQKFKLGKWNGIRNKTWIRRYYKWEELSKIICQHLYILHSIIFRLSFSFSFFLLKEKDKWLKWIPWKGMWVQELKISIKRRFMIIDVYNKVLFKNKNCLLKFRAPKFNVH